MTPLTRVWNRLLRAFAGEIRYTVPLGGVLAIMTVLTHLGTASPLQAEQFGVSRRGNGDIPTSRVETMLPPVPFDSALPDIAAAPAAAAPKVGSPFALPITLPSTGLPSGFASDAQTAMPNIVRLVAFDQSGQSFGSGSYIGNQDEYGLILSNWHVVCEADGLVHVHFPNGFSSFGAIVLSDKKWDLAIIVVSKPPNSVTPLPIARNIPKPGDPLWIAGYGSGSYRLAGGRCVRYLAPELPQNGDAPQYEIIELSASARQGDSGGPILNRSGELAGVLFGSDMVRNTAGSYCERVNRFLQQAKPAMDKLPKRPEAYFASVEPQGPRHRLGDSHREVSKETMASAPPARRVDLGGSGGSFGIRSHSRRYTQAATPISFSVFEKNQETPNVPIATPVGEGQPNERNDGGLPPLTNRVPAEGLQGVQTAAWAQPTERKILQAKHTASPPENPLEKENVLAIPGPFDTDRSSLNPATKSKMKSVADLPTLAADKGLQDATVAEKYAGLSSTANQTETDELRGLKAVSERNEGLPTFFWMTLLLLAGSLVYFSIRLLRNEQDEEDETILSTETFRRQSSRADAA